MIAGRYELVREVGRGGMGAVWLARDELLGRQVAAKRIGMAPGGETPDLERAEREARLAASLNHPHVVAVYDLVVEDGQQWLVMEYVEGRSLAELLRADGPLTPDRAAVVMSQVADALVTAHAAGIVHRDVKPSNILVATTERGDQAKLTDFGIARAQADASLTQTGMVTGSPAYLAPEIASGAAATSAGDAWSVGATLFHALAGRAPYDAGENVMGTLYQIVHSEPPRLPPGTAYADVLAATMVKDPAARWPLTRIRDALRGDHDPLATQAWTPPPVHAPEPAPDPEPQAPSQSVDTPSRRLLLGGLALLLVAVIAAVALWPRDEDPDPTAEDSPAATGTDPTTDPTPDPTAEPTEDPSVGETDGPATEQQLRDFVTGYLDEVTSNRRAAFARLTPAFQQASGGFTGYADFWRTVESARVSDIRVDAESLEVSYRVRYVGTNGGEFGGSVTLQLVRLDDTYLIDGES